MSLSLQPQLKKINLLIVDDRESDREFYKECLELEPEYEYLISEASSVAEALDLASSNDYDCILLDYRLPDRTGLDFLTEAKDFCHAAVIMLTDLGDELLVVKALKNGADNYLPKKAIDPSVLQNIIKQSCENQLLKKQIEQQNMELARSNQDLESFAYLASHDLKEPLRHIIEFGTILESKHSENLNEKGLKYLEYMTTASQRMQKLLESLLEYSRVSSTKLDFELVDLESLIERTIFELGLDKLGAEISLDVEGMLPKIEAETGLLTSLFLNLIQNSVKFQEPGNLPIVKITIKQEASNLLIYIQDNGLGFPQNKAEDIFNQFYRLNNKSHYEGSGMGLSICKRIVERHGGAIEAKSCLGEGSLFTVSLPIHQNH